MLADGVEQENAAEIPEEEQKTEQPLAKNPEFEQKQREFMDFIYESPTSVHCAENLITILKSKGYEELKDGDDWSKAPSHFYIKNGFGNLIAVNKKDLSRATIAVARSDYPSFKVSQKSYRQSALCEQLRTKPIGNGLWFSWTDRDLRIAGQAQIKQENDENAPPVVKYFKSPVPIAVIPSLAVHLASGSGVKPVFKIDQHFFPIVALNKGKSKKNPEQSPVLMNFIANLCDTTPENIVSFDVFLSDSEKPELVGIDEEFIVGQGIVGPGTAFAAFSGFINANDPAKGSNVFALIENESFNSNLLKTTLTRLGFKSFAFSKSQLFTVSGLPGIHPNFSKDTDSNSSIALGQGIMYNWSSDLKYASISSGVAKMQFIAKKVGIKLNPNVPKNKNESASPSLISKLGVQSTELAIPVLGVGAIREMAHYQDIDTMIRYITNLFNLLE